MIENQNQTPGKPTGSLWTTPASEATSLDAIQRSLVDKSVTVEAIRSALAATKDRAAAFSGRISDEDLRTSVE